MPVALFQMPDGRVARFEVPEGTTPEQANTMMQQHFSQSPQGGDKLELAKEPSTFDNLAAGFKSGLKGVGQGIGQVIGTTSREDVAKQRELDKPVLDTTAGTIGNIAGTVAGYAPAAFIPGVNTALGGAIVGAGIGAIQPSASTNETLANTGLGGVGGAIGSKISQFLASRAAARAARSAAVAPAISAKNATLEAAQKARYAVPPQDSGAGTGSQLLNAVSGKIKTEQKASVLNQAVTNSKAAKAIGLPEHEPITLDAIDGVRKQAGKAYEAVRGVGQIKADGLFKQELGDIVKKYQSASKDFPGLLNDDVTKVVSNVDRPQFSSDSAIDAIGILRKQGDAAYRSGNSEVGAASKKAADAIESMIGRHLKTSGAPQDLITNFQNARQLIAKTYTVEKALNTGSGNIKAAKIAAEMEKKGTLTGDLKDIGKFAKAFPRSNQELAGVNPWSVIDAGVAGIGGGVVNPMIAAGVAARPVVRSMILSPTYQKMFVKGAMPKAAPSSLMRLGAKAAVPLSALAAIKGGQ
jgi:hypothetical protein